VVEVNDLDGSRELLVGQVPDPESAIPQDHTALGTVKAAAACFAVRPLGEGRGCVVSVATS
jgi:hypothetical protein